MALHNIFMAYWCRMYVGEHRFCVIPYLNLGGTPGLGFQDDWLLQFMFLLPVLVSVSNSSEMLVRSGTASSVGKALCADWVSDLVHGVSSSLILGKFGLK